MRNGMDTNPLFNISESFDLVHGSILLMKGEIDQHLQTPARLCFAIKNLFRVVVFMIPHM
jgi:hypothetical protein